MRSLPVHARAPLKAGAAVPAAAAQPLLAATDPFLTDPHCFDNFEQDPDQALLLLMHNTNLASCPALQELRDLPQAERDDPGIFDAVIDRCKAEVMAIVSGIQHARPAQLAAYYDARDRRRPLHSCTACTSSPVLTAPLAPRTGLRVCPDPRGQRRR